MKLFRFWPILLILICLCSTLSAYPIDYLEDDFVMPEETEVEWFISGIIAQIPRTVEFSNAEDNDNDESKPHLGYGFGVLFPNGVHNMMGDFLGDFLGPFGIRVAYLTGGPLSPEGDALDLNNPEKEPYKSTIFELEIIRPYGVGGRGFSFILTSWEYISTTTVPTEYRGIEIPEGTRMKQAIGIVGFEIPVTLMDYKDISFGTPTTSFGLLGRYEILILNFQTLTPEIDDTIGSHILTFGAFFNCGVFDWLYTEIAIQLGGGISGPSAFVAHINFLVEYTQKPPFYYGDHVEIFVTFKGDVTVTNFGEMYLYDPNAEFEDEKGEISWGRLDVRLGVRIWF